MEAKSRRTRRAWLALAVLLAFTAVHAGGFALQKNLRRQVDELEEKQAFFLAVVESEADWLLASQLENGALPFYPALYGEASVNPYFACNAGLALLARGSEADVAAVRAYLDWHLAHLNAGEKDQNRLLYTIYDYTVTLGSDGRVLGETAKGNYDSADAYGALLLTLLRAYYDATGDAAYLLAHHREFSGVLSMLESLVRNGLAIAKPDYPVSFLMDNCEVNEALLDAIALYNEVYLSGVTQSAEAADARLQYNRIVALQAELSEAIELRLWMEEGLHYAPSVQGEAYPSFEWSRMYPDASAQLYPIIHALIPPSSARAQALYASFCRYQDWTDLSRHAQDPASFYWSNIALAAARMGDVEGVYAYLSYYMAHIAPTHAYPLYNGDAACALRAAALCADAYALRLEKLDPLELFHDA